MPSQTKPVKECEHKAAYPVGYVVCEKYQMAIVEFECGDCNERLWDSGQVTGDMRG